MAKTRLTFDELLLVKVVEAFTAPVKAGVTRLDQLGKPGEYHGILICTSHAIIFPCHDKLPIHIVFVASSVTQARGRHL